VRVEPSPKNGLAALSFIKCEQLLTVSKERLEQRTGRISDEELARVDAALRVVLAL
jgi:mRNA interferase MazF